MQDSYDASVASVAIEEGIRLRLSEHGALVASLLDEREQLLGSLFSRYARCGKPSCACANGAAHGPYFVLSDPSLRRQRFRYLGAEQVPVARDLIARRRRFRRGLRRLQVLNTRLHRLLGRYSTTANRRGATRLALVSSRKM
jgi:hypothetical protein